MKPVVYVDVLFFINLFINYILLWTTSKISKNHTSIIRLLIGAAVGAIYSVVIFFPALRIYYTMIAKILFSMALIAITFNIAKVREFLKTLGVFYIVSFTFGGAALGLFYFTNIGAFVGAVFSNGIIYFNLPWKILVASSTIAYIIIRVTSRVINKAVNRENMYTSISIVFDQKTISINALIDTGNALYDPVSDSPVIVVEFQAIKDLLPEEVKNIFVECSENDLSLISKVMCDSVWAKRFRLIPFTSLGKENGMLIGFKPDLVEVIEETQKRDLKDIVIGIYNKRLSKDEKYKALLHPEVLA